MSSRLSIQMMVGSSKNEAGTITKIQHIKFAPSTGTKRRLGVVERFNRTFREKYVTCARNMKKLKKTAYFSQAIPQILEENNFIDDHRSIKEFSTRYKAKVSISSHLIKRMILKLPIICS